MKLETKYLVKDDNNNLVNEYCFLEKCKCAEFYYAKKEENGKYVILNLNYEEISKYVYINFEFYKFPYALEKDAIFAIGVILKPNKHKRYVILNYKGEKIIHEEFIYLVFGEKNKTVIARRYKKCGVIDYTGKEIIPFEYDYISYIEELDIYRCCIDGEVEEIEV